MTSAKFSLWNLHCSRPGSSFYGKIANFLESRKFSDGTTFQLLILPFFLFSHVRAVLLCVYLCNYIAVK
jgi:hypothetical protein